MAINLNGGTLKMFGPTLSVAWDGFRVTLKPHDIRYMELYAQCISDFRVLRYMEMFRGVATEDEKEWYESARKSEDSIHWAIHVDDMKEPVGSTSLHNISRTTQRATSGVVIFDVTNWGRGVASRAHLIRTWFAANVLNRYKINSGVFVLNKASLKALHRVGYFKTGVDPMYGFLEGRYVDLIDLTWLNPKVKNLLYPEGNIPVKISKAMEKAELALKKGDKLIER